eukprot:s9574_g1.t1
MRKLARMIMTAHGPQEVIEEAARALQKLRPAISWTLKLVMTNMELGKRLFKLFPPASATKCFLRRRQWRGYAAALVTAIGAALTKRGLRTCLNADARGSHGAERLYASIGFANQGQVQLVRFSEHAPEPCA